MINRSEAGKRVKTSQGMGTVVFYTDGYAGELDYYLVALDVPAEYGVSQVYVAPSDVTEPEPKKIKFESRNCSRCDGLGRSTHWGLDRNTCFRCKGSGAFLTEAGKVAREAYDKALKDAFETPFGALPIGAKLRIKEGGKVFTKGPDSVGVLPADHTVWRVDVTQKIQIMRDIAAQYPGASLTY